ncbi:hypothetical protein B0H11DRAFT_2183825 [Mycena galericulata]|nr:hypothetical protein B0H11DRAFT_2183825 [Mycena galericulata]
MAMGDDNEQDSLHTVLHSDNTVLVATTLATLVLAGGALICRSGRRFVFPTHAELDADKKKQAAADAAHDDTKDAKNTARSKERRRRGKDPLKEILKGGKKLKMLTVGTPRDRDDPGSSTSTSAINSPLPRIPDSGSSQRSASVSTSGRSVSSSTASSTAAAAPTSGDTQTGDSTPGAHKPDDVAADSLRDIAEIPEISISAGVAVSPSDSSSGSTVLSQPQYGRHTTGLASPWDWDGQGSSVPPPPEVTSSYRKPPRFRSKSRGSPPTVPIPSTVDSPQQLSALSDDISFPTLNPPVGSSAVPRPRAPLPRATRPPAHPRRRSAHRHSSRPCAVRSRLRACAKRTCARSSNAPPRTLRWCAGRTTTGGRRELELQAQIHHLMHQLQAYAALFAAQAQQVHMQVAGGGGSPGPASPGAYPTPPMPMPMFSHGMLSPVSVNGQPFFAYPAAPPPPFPPLQQPPPLPPHQQQQQSPLPPQQQQQPTLFEMLFPMPVQSGSGSGSGTSSSVSASASGSGSGSSVGSGSGSPDLVGSPAPLDRGRRRTRTQTAEARFGPGGSSAGWDEGWVGVEALDGEAIDEAGEDAPHDDAEEEDGSGYYDDEEEDGGFGVSGALADAILKRPESIRVRSRKGRERDKERARAQAQATTEFTFPSLSDFAVGNVNGGGGVYRDWEQNGDVGAVQPGLGMGAEQGLEQEHEHEHGHEQQEQQEQDEAPSDPSEPFGPAHES